MKVAYNAILLGNYFSGVEVTLSKLGEKLSHELANDLHIFINDNAKDKYAFPNAELHPVKLTCNCRIARVIWEHFMLQKRIKELGCDLLHCPAYIAPYKIDCPTVVTVHDIISLTHPELCKVTNVMYYRLMLERSIRQAAQVIVPSNVVKEQLVNLFETDPKKINVVPFAPSEVFKRIKDEDLLKQVKKKYNLPDKFILFLANHEPKKNIAGVVQAFAEFRKKAKGYKLVLAGRAAWGTGRTKKLIYKLAIEKDIIWPGYVPIADLLAIYSLADVFLFPSLDEGFGIPVLEAMACGAPVICSDRGALPETTAGAAVCLPPDDYSLMAEKLAEFSENPALRDEYIKKGLKRVRGLSWDKTALATMEVYKKAIE